jgi:hypothetical protein
MDVPMIRWLTAMPSLRLYTTRQQGGQAIAGEHNPPLRDVLCHQRVTVREYSHDGDFACIPSAALSAHPQLDEQSSSLP